MSLSLSDAVVLMVLQISAAIVLLLLQTLCLYPIQHYFWFYRLFVFIRSNSTSDFADVFVFTRRSSTSGFADIRRNSTSGFADSLSLSDEIVLLVLQMSVSLPDAVVLLFLRMSLSLPDAILLLVLQLSVSLFYLRLGMVLEIVWVELCLHVLTRLHGMHNDKFTFNNRSNWHQYHVDLLSVFSNLLDIREIFFLVKRLQFRSAVVLQKSEVIVAFLDSRSASVSVLRGTGELNSLFTLLM